MAMHIYDLGWMLAQVLLLLCSAPLVAGIIKSESLAAESYRFQYFPGIFRSL